MGLCLLPAATSQEDDPQWTRIPRGVRDSGVARAERHGMFAAFTHDDAGNVDGKWVSFHYDNDTGVVQDLTLKRDNRSLVFFTSVTPTPWDANAEPRLAGSSFHAAGSTMTVRVHNNPIGLSGWHSHENGTTVTFQLATGATITGDGTQRQLRIDQGGGHGHILSNGNRSIDVSANAVTLHLDQGESALFVAHPLRGPAAAVLHLMNTIFVAKKLGAFANLADGGGQAIIDGLELDANITVNTIGKGGLTITANGNSSSPKILIFIIDADTLDCTRGERIHVTLNGQRLNNTNAPDDANSDDATAKVHVLCGDRLAMVIVKVAHFSSQTIEINDAEAPAGATTSAPETGDRTGSPALEVLPLLVGLVLVLLVVRRRLGRQ